MKSLVCILSAILIVITVSAQEKKGSTLGFEIDALPFILGGYYGSMWIGSNHVRCRAVITQVTTPQFLLDDGFTNNKIRVYAGIVDYFFKPGFEKWWVGSGLEYWRGSIQTNAKLSTEKYDQAIFTLGGGYAWRFHKRFYLNPWVAIHARLAGENKVLVDGKDLSPAAFIPEASIKVGWFFNIKR